MLPIESLITKLHSINNIHDYSVTVIIDTNTTINLTKIINNDIVNSVKESFFFYNVPRTIITKGTYGITFPIFKENKKFIGVIALSGEEVDVKSKSWNILLEMIAILIEEAYNDTPQLLNYNFTKRESEILQYIVQGSSDKYISFSMKISIPTVRKHLSSLFIKTKTKSRAELISFYYQNANSHTLNKSKSFLVN